MNNSQFGARALLFGATFALQVAALPSLGEVSEISIYHHDTLTSVQMRKTSESNGLECRVDILSSTDKDFHSLSLIFLLSQNDGVVHAALINLLLRKEAYYPGPSETRPNYDVSWNSTGGFSIRALPWIEGDNTMYASKVIPGPKVLETVRQLDSVDEITVRRENGELAAKFVNTAKVWEPLNRCLKHHGSSEIE